MDMKISALAIALTTAALTGAANAQVPGMGDTIAQGEAPTFDQIDRNMDGSITTREAEGTWLAGSFAEVDANKDGLVDKQEYNEALS